MSRADSGDDTREAALDLASMGYSVFPVSGKKPLVLWKECQSRRASAEQIEAWWTEHARANVGLVTGAVSGVFVLDIDGPEGHAALAEHGFEISETVHARTARGDHYVFEHPGFEVRNFAGGPSGVRLSHVDLRGDGGFVVVPPSVHPSGAQYEWVVSPFDRKPASAPEWLLELIRPRHATAEVATPKPITVSSVAGSASMEYLRAALEGEAAKVRQAHEGERNHRLNASAFALGQLVAAGLDEASIIATLGEAAAGVGLESEEIGSTLRSGLDAGMHEPREIPKKGSSVLHFSSEDKGEDVAATALPEYPVHAFPEPVRSYVIEAAVSIDCPPEMVALPLLTYAGSTIGNTRYLVLKSDYIVYPILWTAIVAPPGSAKTPADKAARYAIDILQADAKYRYDDEMDGYRADYERWKHRPKSKKGEVVEFEPEPERPVLEHFYTTDATIEAMAMIVSRSAGVAFARDELVGWVKSMDAYKANRGAERSQYLSLWSGSALKVDRKGQEPLLIEHPVVGVTGGIQPDVLHELASEVGRKDGFLERFCFSYCESPSPGWSERVVSDDLRRDLLGVFRGLRSHGHINQGAGLSPEAKAAWVEFVDRNSEITDSSTGILRGMNAKMPVHLASITLVLHCLAGEAATTGSRVSGKTIAAAIEIVEYHRAHNASVLKRIEGGDKKPSPDLADRLLSLLSASPDGLSRSELDRKLNGQVAAADRDATLKRLEGRGVVECVRVESGPNGGAPAIYWRVRHAA